MSLSNNFARFIKLKEEKKLLTSSYAYDIISAYGGHYENKI